MTSHDNFSDTTSILVDWMEKPVAGNKVCFDCGAENPTMAALLYGTCICDDCADIHLTFGSSISVVRPIYFDDWPNRKVALMVLGGNNRARHFFEYHGWTGGSDLQVKYLSEVATLYRTTLADKVKEMLGDERPHINVTEDVKECTLEDKNPETSPAISSADNLVGCGVNEPPPICSVQNIIDQVPIQVALPICV